jgi:hypothetical protein
MSGKKSDDLRSSFKPSSSLSLPIMGRYADIPKKAFVDPKYNSGPSGHSISKEYPQEEVSSNSDDDSSPKYPLIRKSFDGLTPSPENKFDVEKRSSGGNSQESSEDDISFEDVFGFGSSAKHKKSKEKDSSEDKEAKGKDSSDEKSRESSEDEFGVGRVLSASPSWVRVIRRPEEFNVGTYVETYKANSPLSNYPDLLEEARKRKTSASQNDDVAAGSPTHKRTLPKRDAGSDAGSTDISTSKSLPTTYWRK